MTAAAKKIAKKTTKRTTKPKGGNGAPVVEGMDEASKVVDIKRAKQTGPKPGKPGSKEWYAKYPHVVKNSVRAATATDVKALGGKDKCHGKICTIKCIDTKKERVVNVQDAFQCKRTVEAQRKHERRCRAERRANRKKVHKAAEQKKAS